MSDSTDAKPFEIEQAINRDARFIQLLQSAQINLQRTYDTSFMAEEIPIIELVLERIKEGFASYAERINLQFLNELENLIIGYSSQVTRWQTEAVRRGELILQTGNHLSEVKSGLSVQPVYGDTAYLPAYLEQRHTLLERLHKIDSLFAAQRLTNLQVQSQLSSLNTQLVDLREETRERQRQFRNQLLNRDSPHIWRPQKTPATRDFRVIVRDSLLLNEVILQRYMGDRPFLFFALILASVLIYFWYKGLVVKIETKKEFSSLILRRARYLTQSPAICTALTILTLAPYFFSFPPYSLILTFLFGMTLCTTWLIRKAVHRKSFLLWLLMVLSFIVYGSLNLVTELAFQEKWYLMSLSILGIWIGVKTLKMIRKNPKGFPKYLEYLIYFYVGMQGLSLLFHIAGRFSLGKMLGVAATLSIMQAINLYVFVLVVMEAIYLQSEDSKTNQKEYTNYLNYQAIYSRLKRIFSFLAICMWLYFLALNFSLNQILFEQFANFLTSPRQIGNTPFTFASILVFIALIWFSSVLAKNVAYFASIRDAKKAEARTKKLGSSILLIRLAVLTIGFFLAVTASGIPLDKLAIVLGALSVGIGFGLQTIVNNLVSGIILAFERPIQIGDAIEVGGRSGVVKEVGIRSSTILSYDGSEVIIPNGDLLSQHLINWTLSDKSRRIEQIIGVAYGSEVQKVHEVLEKALERDSILRQPPPRVLLHNFADSAVEFRLLFWVSDFSQWVTVKNEVLRDIYQAFKEAGIQIPFPQRDLHIKMDQTEIKDISNKSGND
ncbi:mechanosensitive ion channel domain-containing protein [Negadavirga shengliensis]|uniref:Mechanosensitive ion channel domain-containing protein n=1 Tax=Negadavirga shengliensis TaxID=1389218 RepID=A0ABV9T6E7_9BACT